MANTYTTNLNLAKPDQGDTYWDDEWHDNMDILDAMFVAETPTGTIDGSNKVFTLSATPVSGTLQLIKFGLYMREGPDYTLSGPQITYVDQQTPKTNEWHHAHFIKGG